MIATPDPCWSSSICENVLSQYSTECLILELNAVHVLGLALLLLAAAAAAAAPAAAAAAAAAAAVMYYDWTQKITCSNGENCMEHVRPAWRELKHVRPAWRGIESTAATPGYDMAEAISLLETACCVTRDVALPMDTKRVRFL